MVVFTSPDMVDQLANLRCLSDSKSKSKPKSGSNSNSNTDNNNNNYNDNDINNKTNSGDGDGDADVDGDDDKDDNDGDNSLSCFPTILVALPLDQLPFASGKLHPKSFWADQLDKDPESMIHAPLRGSKDPRLLGKFESG